MEIVKQLENIPNLSLALGFFDGVHLAHQKVISEAVLFAKNNNCKSAVLTFKKHPKSYFSTDSQYYITSEVTREKLISMLGVDYLIELDFESVCRLTPQDYIEHVLIKYFKPKFITTGFNHFFGCNKTGSVQTLKNFQKIGNYSYNVVPKMMIKNQLISSTAIKNHLLNGEIHVANLMLGRNFSLTGNVIKGKELGHTLGFPTANFLYPSDIISVPNGVYAVNVSIDGKIYKGLTNFGTCPTVSSSMQRILETHILDFADDIYGKQITIELIKKIRNEIKFNSVDDLIKQIQIDIQQINNIA